MDKRTASHIYGRLKKKYGEVSTALEYRSPLQLLVATILSAQCTDERVNKVTKVLFGKYRTAEDFSKTRQETLQKEIRSTGFYRNKARNIIGAATRICREFHGEVPDTMEDLLSLPGVARKTANIVLFHAFGKKEGIAVDTHVRRVSLRLGMTGSEDPVKIEKDLMELFRRDKWGQLTNLFIAHGRAICKARKPRCPDCVVRQLCPSADTFQ